MANPEQVAMLKRSVEEWNEWRRTRYPAHGSRPVDIDLRGAGLSYLDLKNADLSWANLYGADLSDSDLRNSDCGLAYLVRCNLSGADLTGASLHAATMSRTLFHSTRLNKTDFANARLGKTLFLGLDLSSALGLESCGHSAPSIVDVITLQRSSHLPIEFLRGCGLPDRWIEYLPSLQNEPVRFYSCFISYSTQDQDFADRLHADLQNNSVRCWFAPHDIAGGKKIHDQIDEAIRVYDRLLLILSESSMVSEWVRTEIANARQKELEHGRQVLFPISIVPYERVRAWKAFDADTGKDSAREIREYFIPDFTGWDTDHGRYKAAFEKLLKGLKAEDKPTDPLNAESA
jgi:hypothetical protein